MPRFFEPISKSDFEIKLFEAAKKNEHYGGEKDWHKCNRGVLAKNLTPQVIKDLKVEFDIENWNDESGYGAGKELPHGISQLDNGLTFYGMSAGGDLELPIYFILYWDGKKVRAYIPTDGNPWNTDTNMAYGNDLGKDMENYKKRYPELEIEMGAFSDFPDKLDAEPQKIIADIKARILRR